MTETPGPATPAKRKARTLEEREAALQAELDNLRTLVRAKDEKRLAVLEEQYRKVHAQVAKVLKKQDELALEIEATRLRLAGGEPSD